MENRDAGRSGRARRRWQAAILAGMVGVLAGCASSDGGSAFTPAPAGSFLPPELPSGWTEKRIQYANRDMVAAANPLAVQAGVRILAQGGTATDAAIATQMVLNLVEPQSSGIGGGAFLLHHDRAANRLVAWDGRETAPAAATEGLFLGANGQPLSFAAAQVGGRSVGAPGLLRMLEAAHRAGGRLPWAALFAPAIELAEQGFAISPRLATLIADPTTRQRILDQGEPIRGYFLNPDGTPKAAGTILRNPELAATLRAVAAGGADAFYTGPIAQAIVDKVRSHPTNPGLLSVQDLADYRARAREAVCGDYRGYRICGMPPPSSGGIAVLQTLGLLRGFDLRQAGPVSLDSVHLVSEAYRLAYADRGRYVADTDFVPVPVAGLLDAAYLARRATLIRLDRSIGVAPAGTPPGAPVALGTDASADLPATSHVSVVDAAGNAVSMTTTIEAAFGSFQMVGGFLLNNQLTDFSFAATDANGPVANRVQPGKRPRSSMAPTIVYDAAGNVEAVVGSPGGAAIIQYVTKTLVGLIDWNLDIQQAANLPNFGAATTATTTLETGTSLLALRPGLEARGHAIAVADQTSGVHGIVFNGIRADGRAGGLARDPSRGTWAGGADPRREGTAAGNP